MSNNTIEEEYKAEAEILKAVGHPIRLKIIEVLVSNKSCVKNIWEALNLPQATVSQHLISLKNKGIVSCKRDGVLMCYELNDKRIEKIFNDLKDYKHQGSAGETRNKNTLKKNKSDKLVILNQPE
jgi:ArsR family transcriptional regulator